MQIPKTYDPSKVESKLYQEWTNRGFFHSTPDKNKKSYTIVIPPPNVTGVLHMGHLLNNTIQDLLIRRARMQGYNACWVPGTDHASIATEAKVVRMLREKGIRKSDLSRNKFLEHAWEWKETYGGIILQQLKKLGASCDWKRTRFTMEDNMYQSVIKVFVDLYNKGMIYRGERMVNWDPAAKTALSDEEVIHREVTGELYYVEYDVPALNKKITIATTRPETILGDTAICVHPEDERFKDFIGKEAIVPVVERPVPIIADEYVDQEFGTGALKITPAHDPNDYELGKKHDLETIDILNADGTLSEAAQFFIGLPREEAREKMVVKLKETGHLVKTEDLTHNVGFSERTNVVIEPRISLQWFVDMRGLAKPALEHVMNDDIRFFPSKFKNSYRNWMENIQDWCISRQLWWGQRIPAYYFGDGKFVVAETMEEALELARKKSGNEDLKSSDLKQDEDVVDTWFSSWLWPITVFDGLIDPKNEDFKYYYPTTILVTAPDIIFFWVARMIMAGYEYTKEKPFDSVYFTGIVRDKLGRKMSKSLGNSPDLLELIENNGADAVRFGALISSPAGNDLLFDEKLIKQGRNFCNKIWNALRLIKTWEDFDKIKDSVNDNLKDKYEKSILLFENKFNAVVAVVEKSYETYRVSEILKMIYSLIWEDFCSTYLEWIKPAKDEDIDKTTFEKTISLFEGLLKLLHPIMPFVTEEIWHYLKDRRENDFITVSEYPEVKGWENDLITDFDKIKSIVTGVRNFRASNKLNPTELLKVSAKSEEQEFYTLYNELIKSAATFESIELTSEIKQSANTLLIGKDQLEIHLEENIDPEAQRKKLQEELNYNKGFLNSVNKKLGNEKFVKNAKPEIVERERQKQKDAEEKIRKLEEAINQLG